MERGTFTPHVFRVQGPRTCNSSFQGVKTKFSGVISHSYRDSHGTSPYVSGGQQKSPDLGYACRLHINPGVHPCPPLPPKGRSLYQKSCTYSSSEARGSVWLACRRAGQVTVGGGSSCTAVFGCSQASRGSMEPRLTP